MLSANSAFVLKTGSADGSQHFEKLPTNSGMIGTDENGNPIDNSLEMYKVKVNAADTNPDYLEAKVADTTDVQFKPTEDNDKIDSIVYQLTGLGAMLNPVKDAGFDFENGPFPAKPSSGGRGICFGRRFVAGVEVDTWVAQGNNGKLYWTNNNDSTRWKVVTEDDSLYTTYPSARTYYGWSCIQFVYVAGTHNCYCWVMGSGDVSKTIFFIEHKEENYNANGTLKTSALNSVTYSEGLGPYSAIDIMQVDTTGGIFIAGDDTRIGYTTDLANFQVVLTADHNIGGMGFDGENTVQVIERDYGVIWKSTAYGEPGTFSKVTSIYVDDVEVSHFPVPNAAQWGSMFCMYGQWLSINFHYVTGGYGFIYSDDGVYWYTSTDQATQFYDANNDGLRWFGTNAVYGSGTPIYQLIVSVIPAHRRMSLEKGAVIDELLLLRHLPDAEVLGTDHRGRVVAKGGYTLPIASDTVLGGIKVGDGLSIDGSGVLTASAISNHNDFSGLQGGTSGEYYHATASEYAKLQQLQVIYDAVVSTSAELQAALESATVNSIYTRLTSAGANIVLGSGSADQTITLGASKNIYGQPFTVGSSTSYVTTLALGTYTLRCRNDRIDVNGKLTFTGTGTAYIKKLSPSGASNLVVGVSGKLIIENLRTPAAVSNATINMWDMPLRSGSSASISGNQVLRYNSSSGEWEPVTVGVSAPFGQELFSYALAETTGAIGSDGNIDTNCNATTRGFAFVPNGTVTISKMRIMITQVGGTNFRLGIYDASGNLVAKSARYTTSNGLKEVNLTLGPSNASLTSVTLNGGEIYYMAYWTDDTTQNFKTSLLSGRSTSTAQPLMQRHSATNQEMPDSIGSGASNTALRPWLMISG